MGRRSAEIATASPLCQGFIELKYIKAGDPAPTAEALAAIRSTAARQLAAYAADGNFATECNLPTVALHQLVIVFHGGNCLLCEEIQ